MTATDNVINPIALTDSEVKFYNREGYLLLPGFVKSDAVASLREEVFQVLEANGLSRESLRKASNEADKLRQFKQYLKGSKLDMLINSPATLAVAARLVGGKAHRYLPFTAVKAGGGGGMFDYHQDNNYTQHDPAVGSINIWVSLVDMTPENGCLRVVPRSHRNWQILERGQTVFIVCHGSRPKFGIPEIVQDIRRSIRFVRAHAAEHGVDPNRLALFGISSGGNISLLAAAQGSAGHPEATDPIDRQSDRVGAVACFYPPTDFLNYGVRGKVWIPYRPAEETADEAALARDYSPVTHFTAAMPPTLIMHGDADALVPYQQSQSAITRLEALGVKNRFEPRPGMGHGWPDMAAEYTVCAAWFDKHLHYHGV